VYSRSKGLGSDRDFRQRDGVRVLSHLEDAERPLHQGDDSPMVEMGEDNFRSQPAAHQIPQRGQE
jgi:hypothetical protein